MFRDVPECSMFLVLSTADIISRKNVSKILKRARVIEKKRFFK